MKKKPSKLKLDKKTISNLNETDVNNVNGGVAQCSWRFCSQSPECATVTILTVL